MTQPHIMLIIKPEIDAPPSVSNLSVAPVRTGMFTVPRQVVMVVRFLTDVLTDLKENMSDLLWRDTK